LRDRLILDEHLRPLELLRRLHQRCFSRGDLRLPLLHGRFEGGALDLEKQLARADAFAGLELPGPEKALDAGAKINLVERLYAPDEFALCREDTQGGRLDQNRGRRSLRQCRRGREQAGAQAANHDRGKRRVRSYHASPMICTDRAWRPA